MGSLEQRNGANYVKSDFMLATAKADIVADPSAPDALYKVLWKVKSGFGIMEDWWKEMLMLGEKKFEVHQQEN